MDISLEEKKILLNAARSSIASIFTDSDLPTTDYKKYPLLETHAGAFVTLTVNKKLRGCIGYIISDQPVFETVCDAAIQAAQNDPRFPPLSQKEFEKISIEISILSPPFPLSCYGDIIIGTHGLILEEKGRRGLLLPQVPVEHKMDRDHYLDAICQKTGFPPGYWKDKQLKLSGFTATVFSEDSEKN
ncbi:MAG: AmmeMemoRadiSam system protein A [Bacteroidota bacterium]